MSIQLIAIIVIGLLLLSYFILNTILLDKKLNEPFMQSIASNIPSNIIQIQKMYNAYKHMPTETLTLIKLKLKSYDFSNSLIVQIIELMNKLIITVAATLLGIAVTVSISMITFLQNNSELKKDYPSWVTSISDVFETISVLINKYTDFLFILLIIFIMVSTHTFFMHRRKAMVGEHLLIIEQIEKERS
ncbi:hypothetical protein MKY48_08605 [Paenibacillus sp. FSL W8-0187]|uniref:hypothetical protein n=1 Tax=Paenibacillus sp. FSL W8-0187 TaxID=2921710 RepID=UPI0030DB07E3